MASIDLLTLNDLEVPLGGTTGPAALSFCRAVWTKPLANELSSEDPAPAERIVHQRALQLHSEATLHRIGFRKHRGYHSCGSVVDRDWVTAYRLLAWIDGEWRQIKYETDLPRPAGDTIHWVNLDAIRTSAVIIELRACGIDTWWPSWNLAAGGLLLEGEVADPIAPRDERLLNVAGIDFGGLPAGLSAEHRHGEIRFRSKHFDIGFCIDRAGFSHFGLDQHDNADTSVNMLRHGPGLFLQGPRLHAVGRSPEIMPSLRNAVEGSIEVSGNRVTYDVSLRAGLLRYTIVWVVHRDRLEMHVTRHNEVAFRAWTSNAWTLAFDCTVTPTHVIGKTTRHGESGVVEFPGWLVAPGHGRFRIEGDHGVTLRSDAFRPQDRTEVAFRLDEETQAEGDHLVPAGTTSATFTLQLATPHVQLRADAPAAVRDAVDRCTLTALSYRPDTSTLSNNGASMHCPICMDNWSDIALRAGELLPGLHALDLVGDSLERWLDGATGYASGNIVNHGVVHAAEDEYLMTGTAALLGLADYLEHRAPDDWAKRFAPQIHKKLARMRARDLDNDGLIESPYRTGTSGSGQWSTCWFDVISFGWKDAFSNALLYAALTRLDALLPEHGINAEALDLSGWAAQLRASYHTAFYNDETGWVAGWRCKNDEIHDHAFLTPTGVAVCAGLFDDETARVMMERLWAEAERVGMPDAYYGLPVCLWPIPDEDRTDILQGYPFGFYQNGGRTHSQSRHFVRALYRVGMQHEADALLERLCAGMADAAVFGGCRSGKDWRYWDDRPSGYEGLLTDQFGILAVAMERWS